MEVDVIDDADKSVNQQANGRCKNPLLKRGQEMKVHVATGTVTGVKSIYMAYVQYYNLLYMGTDGGSYRKAISIRYS